MPSNKSKTYFFKERVFLPDGTLVDADDEDSIAPWRKKKNNSYLELTYETRKESITQFDPAPIAEDDAQSQEIIDYFFKHLNSKENFEKLVKGLEPLLKTPKPVYLALQNTLMHMKRYNSIPFTKQAHVMFVRSLQYLQENDVSLPMEWHIYLLHFRGNRTIQNFAQFYNFWSPAILNFRMPILFKYLHLIVTGKSSDFVPIFKYALQNGSDINAKEPGFSGTMLHYYIAHEWPDSDFLIDQFEKARDNGLAQFNYSIQDIEGKTPLLIAAKCRRSSAVIKLLSLQARGIEVAVDIPDNQGRTPLLMAAALSEPESVEALLKAGADAKAKDNKGRGLDYYMNLPQEEVEAILHSIQIEPRRALDSRESWLTNHNMTAYIRSDESKDSQKRVLISYENIDLIKKISDEALANGYPQLNDAIKNYFMGEWSKKPGLSVIEDCLTKRPQVIAVVEEYKAKDTSEPKPEIELMASPVPTYANPFMAVTSQTSSPMLASPSPTATASAGLLGSMLAFDFQLMLTLLVMVMIAAIMRQAFNKPRTHGTEAVLEPTAE